ncbi:MAG: hypothetical protein KDD06_07175 [Phaeodactylibacter sp.]|nr:hypothetical protein [Phaeodactylibacter sp.]MCB9287949.1 hypothetical protein [Lewinellaceae bacterium]
MEAIIDIIKRLLGITSKPCHTVDNLFILGGYDARLSSDTDEWEGGKIEDLAYDYFTIVGPYNPYCPAEEPECNWLDNWMAEHVEECCENNICLAYTIVPNRDNGFPIRNTDLADASDEDMEGWINDVEEQARRALDNPDLNGRIAIWCMKPEEMAPPPDRIHESLLARMYEKIKELDPLERPIMMFEPQHARLTRLKDHIPYQDILSVAIYPHHAGNSHNRLQVRNAMERMMQAIDETRSTALPIPTLEMWDANEPPEGAHPGEAYPLDPVDIPRFVTHDAFCAFANGAKGFFIWSMWRRSFFGENYSTFYHAWRGVSHQLHDWKLKEVILKGNILEGIEAEVTTGEETIRFLWEATGADETYPSLSQRAWAYASNIYVLVVSSSEEPVEFTLSGMPNGTYEELFTEVNYTTSSDGSLALSLPALGVLLLKGGSRGCLGALLGRLF